MAGGGRPKPRFVATRRRAQLAATLLAGAVTAALAFSGLGGAARAVPSTSQSATPAAAPEATTSSWSVRPGHTFRVRGPGFRAGSTVNISLDLEARRPQARAVANAGGDVNAVLMAPKAATPGWQAVVLRGTASNGQALMEEAGIDVTR